MSSAVGTVIYGSASHIAHIRTLCRTWPYNCVQHRRTLQTLGHVRLMYRRTRKDSLLGYAFHLLLVPNGGHRNVQTCDELFAV